MLITTMLLLIEEALPICIFYTYIQLWREHSVRTARNVEWAKYPATLFIMFTLIIAILCGFGLNYVRPSLSAAVDGIGEEIWLSIVSIAVVLLSLVAITRNHCFFYLSLFLLTIPHSSNFMIYVQSMLPTPLPSSLLIGASLGLGICISFAYLLYYCLSILRSPFILILGTSLYLSSILGNSITLMQQADLIPSSLPLWDSSHIIADKHEYGQLLHVLMGYTAKPTGWYLFGISLSVGLLFSTLLLIIHYKYHINTDTRDPVQGAQ